MTERQKEVCGAIEAAARDLGYPPTLRELAERLGITVAGVHHHMLRLRELGAVTWDPHAARTLRVVAMTAAP